MRVMPVPWCVIHERSGRWVESLSFSTKIEILMVQMLPDIKLFTLGTSRKIPGQCDGRDEHSPK